MSGPVSVRGDSPVSLSKLRTTPLSAQEKIWYRNRDSGIWRYGTILEVKRGELRVDCGGVNDWVNSKSHEIRKTDVEPERTFSAHVLTVSKACRRA